MCIPIGSRVFEVGEDGRLDPGTVIWSSKRALAYQLDAAGATDPEGPVFAGRRGPDGEWLSEDGTALLDLDYPEDSACDTDMNVVMTGAGHFVEVQGTAEGDPFTRAEMNQLMDLAEKGIRELIEAQKLALTQPLKR